MARMHAVGLGRIGVVAVASILPAACSLRHGSRVVPARAAALASARAELAAAASKRDLDAVLRRLAPNATLTLGRDTLDLRALVTRLQADVGPADSSILWFAPRDLRICDRFFYESGGQAGTHVVPNGGAATNTIYRYALAWTADSSGMPLVQSVALVRGEFGGQSPAIGGCRPSVVARFEPHRLGVALAPGVGSLAGTPLTGIEGALRDRGMGLRQYGDLAGYPSPGVNPPALAAVWFRVRGNLWVEYVGALSIARTATSGANAAAGKLVGLRLDQRWGAALAAVRWRGVRLGVGPLLMREAWHVSVDSLHVDSTGATVGPHLTDAGSTRNRLGVLAQAALVAPLTDRAFLEFRAFALLLGTEGTPPAVGFPALTVTSRSPGGAVLLGVAF